MELLYHHIVHEDPTAEIEIIKEWPKAPETQLDDRMS